jgi:hypothetical protein
MEEILSTIAVLPLLLRRWSQQALGVAAHQQRIGPDRWDRRGSRRRPHDQHEDEEKPRPVQLRSASEGRTHQTCGRSELDREPRRRTVQWSGAGTAALPSARRWSRPQSVRACRARSAIPRTNPFWLGALGVFWQDQTRADITMTGSWRWALTARCARPAGRYRRRSGCDGDDAHGASVPVGLSRPPGLGSDDVPLHRYRALAQSALELVGPLACVAR